MTVRLFQDRTGCRQWRITGTWLALSLFCAGCAIEQEISRTPRTAVEQLLLTGAVDQALTNLTLTLPAQADLHLEVRRVLHRSRAIKHA